MPRLRIEIAHLIQSIGNHNGVVKLLEKMKRHIMVLKWFLILLDHFFFFSSFVLQSQSELLLHPSFLLLPWVRSSLAFSKMPYWRRVRPNALFLFSLSSMNFNKALGLFGKEYGYWTEIGYPLFDYIRSFGLVHLQVIWNNDLGICEIGPA
jgi:hypothetical protein